MHDNIPFSSSVSLESLFALQEKSNHDDTENATMKPDH